MIWLLQKLKSNLHLSLAVQSAVNDSSNLVQKPEIAAWILTQLLLEYGLNITQAFEVNLISNSSRKNTAPKTPFLDCHNIGCLQGLCLDNNSPSRPTDQVECNNFWSGKPHKLCLWLPGDQVRSKTYNQNRWKLNIGITIVFLSGMQHNLDQNLRNGGSSFSPLFDQYCGRIIPPTITSFGNQIYLRYHRNWGRKVFYLRTIQVPLGQLCVRRRIPDLLGFNLHRVSNR